MSRIGQLAEWRQVVVPDWLTEIVQLHRTPVPWAQMIRAGIAICLPLGVAIAAGERPLGLLTAMGGLLGTVVDKGGPYSARVKRVACAAVFGGAAGLTIGSVIHGHGWVAVVALVVVAAISAVLTALGDVGSVTGLQLLVYTSLGLGPLGAVRPWWHTVLGFLLGTLWALILTVPGWLLSPRGAEQQSVAAVYRGLADQLAAGGTARHAEVRRAVTAAFNAAYDALLSARASAAGRDPRIARLMVLLNQASLVGESTAALNQEGSQPPRAVTDAVRRLADAIQDGRYPEIDIPQWGSSRAASALRDALTEAAHLISRKARTPDSGRAAKPSLRDRIASARERARAWVERVSDQFSPTFSLRLMACIGMAGVMIEVLPLTRSYWVLLTVAIVLKPDFGSVFTRALQRGLGTVIGAVLGAVILAAVPYGLWLLVPFGVLAVLLPYGQSRNYGMFAVFLTPFVVVLIDLLAPAGWHLALDRLLDTLLGCAIVLLIGYAPWPASWHSHLPGRFAQTIREVCEYLKSALILQPEEESAPPVGGRSGSGLPHQARLRRRTYRALSELRAEFQRAMSEPASARQRAAAWWPGLIGLEEVVDAVTASALAIRRGAPAPSPEAVRQLDGVLGSVAAMIDSGDSRPAAIDVPSDPALKPVTQAVCSVLVVIGRGKAPGSATAAT